MLQGSLQPQNKTKHKQNENKTDDITASSDVSIPQKRKFGEYENVLLSDDEYEILKKEFPDDYEDRIERLSTYIESKDVFYKNHLATIRDWAKRDPPKPEKKKLPDWN